MLRPLNIATAATHVLDDIAMFVAGVGTSLMFRVLLRYCRAFCGHSKAMDSGQVRPLIDSSVKTGIVDVTTIRSSTAMMGPHWDGIIDEDFLGDGIVGLWRAHARCAAQYGHKNETRTPTSCRARCDSVML